MAKEKISPGMQQYLDIKENYPDAFLLFRMGDFYELFYDDAVKAAQILEISLTSRNKNADNPIPMAGVPYHSAQAYIDVLVDPAGGEDVHLDGLPSFSEGPLHTDALRDLPYQTVTGMWTEASGAHLLCGQPVCI